MRSGARLAFRHHGAVVDPIRRQLLFDFERQASATYGPSAASEPYPLRKPGGTSARGIQDRFQAAIQAEEAGEKQSAIALYEEILETGSGLRRGLHQPRYDSLSSARVQQG